MPICVRDELEALQEGIDVDVGQLLGLVGFSLLLICFLAPIEDSLQFLLLSFEDFLGNLGRDDRRAVELLVGR